MHLPRPLAFFLSGWQPQQIIPPQQSQSISLTLRHVHSHAGSKVVFKDIPQDRLHTFTANGEQTEFSFEPILVKTYKPRSKEQFFRVREAKRQSIRDRRELDDEEVVVWDQWEVPGPDTSKRDALTALAKMTWNSYMNDDDATWYDLGDDWPHHHPFGWEPDQDGFRGHVFTTPDNSTVVVSIKGTSAGVFGGGGPTVRKDKINDNLLFSCCCARVDWSWTTVCGCYKGGWKCDRDCLQQSLVDDTLFYPVGTNLYNNLTYMYPNSDIWLTGHSLGGALSSLLGITFGSPVVTFEAPADKMASKRLHLPQPPDIQHVTHVFHTADPIPMGTCTGTLSSCAIAGYALESRCHLGRKRVYDTITRYGWAQDVRTHRIGVIIDKLLAEDWEPPSEDGSSPGRQVPELTWDDEECDKQECYSWEYGDFTDDPATRNVSSTLHAQC